MKKNIQIHLFFVEILQGKKSKKSPMKNFNIPDLNTRLKTHFLISKLFIL